MKPARMCEPTLLRRRTKSRHCARKYGRSSERWKDAIASHEFQKARYYSDQERKEREKLSELEEKHHVTAVAPVTREAIEEVLSGWTGIPVSKIRESGKA